MPKADGTDRLVSTFEIADEVVSAQLFHGLTGKNRAKFSAHSYAYRTDLSPHDAVEYMAAEFSQHQRLFVAEFDFTKYFDTISHEYLRATFRDQRIVSTDSESALIDAFLKAPMPVTSEDWKDGGNRPLRSKGLPQGTSISLFLANLAATPLDRRLERLGVNFARYADDTVIWSEEYNEINRAVSALQESSKEIGSPINFKKSPGVRLLTPDGTKNAEMPKTSSVDFLGHAIALDAVAMRDRAQAKLKSNVQRLIYDNLLREPRDGTTNIDRLITVDWDYVVLISQLRRYLYGPLSEDRIRAFQVGDMPPAQFEGMMSFYPLVNDRAQLRKLDGWILSQVWLALRRRRLLIGSRVSSVYPWDLTKSELSAAQIEVSAGGEKWDLRMPSLTRISDVIQSVIAAHGPSAVRRHDVYSYGD
ncbi:reverse transcriptase domain-containing protein [Curtobacterium flaccumfaciens pv. flaccumfaciens]|uniref:reverse transcriptase domain-containing protein n=1 Tax=Curtobacterium flaccumfaciens TaxID=2035 RepID=UPI00217EBBDF|nr:reverse transcriptase domain-containing protein [Curtobacterium flaccumfaciens]MCS6567484.1 reverse transcriptase domain-containing protein [Curtobacterium flaccumfaciens pv. flaccumfaciens]MCS6585566.1 reverse transcriptase domain-containing protein [Curtobacterium flaccumfaciens pv. flaccumfaciens]